MLEWLNRTQETTYLYLFEVLLLKDMTEGTDGYSGGRVEWGRRHSASIAPAGHTILPVLHMLSDPEAL